MVLMTIGDDIFTILGMMPIRDRAGIQRATMADEAAKASANAEGQTLTQQGQAPPPIQLPPMGAPADVQLPDDVPTSYAAGSSKPQVTLPAPTERTIASSPAAAPTPKVQRYSDAILDEMIKRKRMDDMNGLFASIGLLAGSLRGGGIGEGRSALIEQAFGGGKPTSVAEMIALGKYRGEEETAEAGRINRERQIQDAMKVHGLDRARAEVQVDQGNAAKLNDPSEMRTAQGIRELEQRKKIARELALKIAKARGTDPAVLLGMAEKDPDKVIELGENEKLTELRAKEAAAEQTELGNLKTRGKFAPWIDAMKDPRAFLAANPDVDPQEFAQWARDPDAFALGMTKAAERAGQLSETGKSAEKRLQTSKTTALKLAEQNAGSNRELQEMWRPDLKTGSPHFSEMMLNFSKSWHKATGQPLPEGTRNTELFVLRQVPATLETIGALGTNPSNPDREYAKEAQGGFGTSAQNIQRLLYLKEKENNIKIAAHNREVEKEAGIHRPLKGKGLEVDYAPPNKFMRAEVEKRKLDKLVAKAVSEGNENDPAIREYFETSDAAGVGPGVFDYYVKVERARQGKK